MSSTRLPGKTLLPLAGKPLIGRIVERISVCKTINCVVLATTTSMLDDPLVEWAKAHNVLCVRGSEEDVLDRYHQAATVVGADIIVRVTADDPFKDPVVIDQVVTRLLDKRLDFACNNNPPSFPEGLDAEVFTVSALARAVNDSVDPFEREHVTQYFYRHPEIFRQDNVASDRNLSHLRWTMDTEQDYRMATEVYRHLEGLGRIFLMDDILSLIARVPSIPLINMNEIRSAMYR
jgi:spore coat polysaccharide biosynthesis protein SpsF